MLRTHSLGELNASLIETHGDDAKSYMRDKVNQRTRLAKKRAWLAGTLASAPNTVDMARDDVKHFGRATAVQIQPANKVQSAAVQGLGEGLHMPLCTFTPAQFLTSCFCPLLAGAVIDEFVETPLLLSEDMSKGRSYRASRGRKLCVLIAQLGWPKSMMCCTQGCRTAQLQHKIKWLHALGHAQESGVLESVVGLHVESSTQGVPVVKVPSCCGGCFAQMESSSFPLFWCQHICCHVCRSASDLNIIAKYRKTHSFQAAQEGDPVHRLGCQECLFVCCRDFCSFLVPFFTFWFICGGDPAAECMRFFGDCLKDYGSCNCCSPEEISTLPLEAILG